MKHHTVDGIDVELDDDIDPADLDKGGEPRGDDEVDLDKLQAEADAAADREDDYSQPADDDHDQDVFDLEDDELDGFDEAPTETEGG